MAEKKLNIIIVGLGKGGTTLIAIFNSYDVVNILGVVDNNPAADGIKLAKTLKIPVTAHWKEFLNNKDLEVVIDVTGSPDVYKTLLKEFPEHVNVISGNAAKIIWMMYEKHRKAGEELERYTKDTEILSEKLRNTLNEMQKKDQRLSDTTEEIKKVNKRLEEKTDNLERFHKMVVDRELRMIKLKEEINILLERLGQPKKYEAPEKIRKTDDRKTKD